MMNFFRKKTVALLLSAVFFSVCFGSIASVTRAESYDPSKNIGWNINAWLGLGLTPPYTDLSGIEEIPENLREDQKFTVFSNIVGAGSVKAVYEQQVHPAKLALDNAQADLDMAAPSSPDLAAATTAYGNARTAFDAAITNLRVELILARRNQNSIITAYTEANKTTEKEAEKINEIVGGASAAEASSTQQALDDFGESLPFTTVINQQELDARREEQRSASAFLADDKYAVAMQDECSFGYLVSGKATNVTPCIAVGVYNLIFKPAMYALMGSGYIFDKVIDLSIKKEFVDQPFINSSWTVVRDFSNMIFIFILLYTGIMTMFGAADWKRTVLHVLFIALIINFSLFFTKVVIDAGNILAVGIRDSINPGLSVSEGLASAFQPQQFIDLAGKVGDPSGGQAIVVFLVATVVTGFAAYVFFKAALLFIGRLIGFWFLMIVSPFAFISTTLPKGNKFHEWLDSLLGLSFVAPIFLFFIYLIMKIISAKPGILGGFSQTSTTAGWFESLLGPVIVATLLCLALMEALKFAEHMAGSFGKMGAEMAGKAMGLAGGVSGIAGRQLIGRAAGAALRGGVVKEGGRLGIGTAAKWATKSSFDVRNFGDKNSLISKTISGKVFEKEQGVGGRVAAEEKRVKEEIKAAEGSKVSIFTEQGIRARAEEAVEKKGEEKRKAEIEAADKFANAAKDLTAELQKQAEAAQAEYDKPVKEAEGSYAEAQKSFEKYKGTEHEPLYKKAMDEAQDKIATAKITQTSSPTSIALKSTIAKLEAEKKKAKADEEEALEKLRVVKLSAEEEAKETVTKINKATIEEYADEAVKAKRYSTADKIRKLNKEKTDKEKYAELGKKLAAEELKKEKEKEAAEGGEEKEEPKHEAEPKH